jgi:NitT/TauT family transport system permease protein
MERPILLLVGIVAILLGWQTVSMLLAQADMPIARFLPPPSAVAEQGATLIGTAAFWKAMGASNARVVAAFAAAMFFGVTIGLLTAWRPEIRALLQPALVLWRYTPVAAIVPLSIIFFGVSDLQKVAVLFMGCVFYVVVLTQDAILRFPISHIDTARSLGLGRTEVFRRVVVPGIAPEIFDTARVAIGLAWSYLLVAEVVAAESGMGFILMRAMRFLQVEQMYFLTLVLAVLGLIYDYAFVLSRRFIFPWIQ